MRGWSRLNDLALQVFAYVCDRKKACDIIRLMHAANHLCYAEFAGKDEFAMVARRHLLTEAEIEVLRRPNGPSPFYLCSCWALELIASSDATPQSVMTMDTSLREWRQNTTLLPLIQLTPLPLPYATPLPPKRRQNYVPVTSSLHRYPLTSPPSQTAL